MPETSNLPPSYEQTAFPDQEKRGRLRLIAARDGRQGAITVHQDVDLFATLLRAGEQVTYEMRPSRKVWVQVAQGGVLVNDKRLSAGDGAAVRDEPVLALTGNRAAEVLLFDLP